MKRDKKPLFILIFYVLAMLAVCFVSVYTIKKASVVTDNAETIDSSDNTSDITQIVYVTLTPSVSTEQSTQTTGNSYWLVKEYEKRVAIFLEDGTLFDVLEVYVKTLPEADRRMLGEGIVIETEDELRSIIEDYTG